MSSQPWLPASRYAPFLGPGWRMRFQKRAGGNTAGRLDPYFKSPDGEVCRSRKEVIAWYDARGLANPEEAQAVHSDEDSAIADDEVDRSTPEYRQQVQLLEEWEKKKKDERSSGNRTARSSPARTKSIAGPKKKLSRVQMAKSRPVRGSSSSSSDESDSASSDSSSSSESESESQDAQSKANLSDAASAKASTTGTHAPTAALAGINLSKQRSKMELSDLQDLSKQLENAVTRNKHQGIIAALQTLNMYSMTIELLQKGTHIAKTVSELAKTSKNNDIKRLAGGLFQYYRELVHEASRSKSAAAPARSVDAASAVADSPVAPAEHAGLGAAQTAADEATGAGPRSPLTSPSSLADASVMASSGMATCPVCGLKAESDSGMKRHIEECLSEGPSQLTDDGSSSNSDLKRKRAALSHNTIEQAESSSTASSAADEMSLHKRPKLGDVPSTEEMNGLQQQPSTPEEVPPASVPDAATDGAAAGGGGIDDKQSIVAAATVTVAVSVDDEQQRAPAPAAADAAQPMPTKAEPDAPVAAASVKPEPSGIPPLARMHSNKILNKYPEGLTEAEFLAEYQTLAKKPFPVMVEQLAVSQPGLFEFINATASAEARIRARAAAVKPLLAKIPEPETQAAAAKPAEQAVAAATAEAAAASAVVCSTSTAVEPQPEQAVVPQAAPSTLEPIAVSLPLPSGGARGALLLAASDSFSRLPPATAAASATTLRSPATNRAAVVDAQSECERKQREAKVRDAQYDMIDHFCRSYMPCFHQSVFDKDFTLRERDLSRELMTLMAKLLIHGSRKQLPLNELREKVDGILGFECQLALKPIASDRTFIMTNDCVAMSGRGELDFADLFGARPSVPFDMPSPDPASVSGRPQSATAGSRPSMPHLRRPSTAPNGRWSSQWRFDEMQLDSDLPPPSIVDGNSEAHLLGDTYRPSPPPLQPSKGLLLELSAPLEPKFYRNLDLLLLGEANFSLSYSLVSNVTVHSLVATSLLAPQEVIDSYQDSTNFLSLLSSYPQVELMFGVDATKLYLQSAVRATADAGWIRKYDRVLFWFPHTGINFSEDRYWSVNSNQILLKQFFGCVHHVVKISGEVHVTLKSEVPYVYWDILEQAKCNNRLEYVTSFLFDKFKFPGYVHRHTTRDQAAPTTHARTYVFRVLPIPYQETNRLKSSTQLGLK
eukprot:TRINITY_DN10025_c0_g1_i2.p1 TRINITY_DN10025_c0_g1~~TRINITY_DN10025_c0_g1_i2.p1  ORF type:complete len:1174 (-),score=307.71 TRINITY_DN10025_c0_g1_i2:759-4280(-)